MTLTMFYRLYQNYKNLWDNEMMLYKTGTTYAKASEMAFKEDDWF